MSFEVDLREMRHLSPAVRGKLEEVDWRPGIPLIVTLQLDGAYAETCGWFERRERGGALVARFCSCSVTGQDVKARGFTLVAREMHRVIARKMPTTRLVDGLRVDVLQVETNDLQTYFTGVARNVQPAGFQFGRTFIPFGRQPGRRGLSIGLSRGASWTPEPRLTSVP